MIMLARTVNIHAAPENSDSSRTFGFAVQKEKKCVDYGPWWRPQREVCSCISILGQISGSLPWQKRKNGLSGSDHFWKFLYLFVQKTIIRCISLCSECLSQFCVVTEDTCSSSHPNKCITAIVAVGTVYWYTRNMHYPDEQKLFLVLYNPLSKHVLLDIDFSIENAAITHHHDPPRPPLWWWSWWADWKHCMMMCAPLNWHYILVYL